MINRALYLFRRDLRLIDNTALINASKDSKEIITSFIFDKNQIENNNYFSTNAFEFMINSIDELSSEIKNQGGNLNLFYGDYINTLEKILSNIKIDAIYVNKDYTPFSINRNKHIAQLCAKYGLIFKEFEDYVLTPINELKTLQNTPYTVYTPFLKAAKRVGVQETNTYKVNNISNHKFDFETNLNQINVIRNPSIALKGGRSEGKRLLIAASKLVDYDKKRDICSENYTSHLSAHIKFGTISVREFYHAISKEHGEDSTLISELYWRDFFTYVGFHHPQVLKGSFKEEYNSIKWSENNFDLWKEGKTGFPIVDAGIRELNQTGYMHNRVRMITASFLVKDMHINWRWGEKYFAQKLIDYDPLVNNGNWQWCASTGCDSTQYFRIFNPWIQQKKFDPECKYIKNWVPELKDFPSNVIQNWYLDKYINYKSNYPRPILNHNIESRITIEMYKNI